MIYDATKSAVIITINVIATPPGDAVNSDEPENGVIAALIHERHASPSSRRVLMRSTPSASSMSDDTSSEILAS